MVQPGDFNSAIRPTTNSVERAFFSATGDPVDSNSNDIPIATIDAQNMDGTNQYWSTNSRSTVTVEDVRIADNQTTKDIFVGMRSTDPSSNAQSDPTSGADSGADYKVFFDQNSLTSEAQSTASQANFQLLDLRSESNDDPLADLNVNGLQFKLGDETVDLQSQEINDAQTFKQLKIEVQEEIKAQAADKPALSNLSAELTGTFTATDDQGILRTGQTLSIIDDQGRTIKSPSVLQDDDQQASFTLFAETSVGQPEIVDQPVTTNAIVDNVGRGSDGGELVIGGQSNDGTNTFGGGNSGSPGIEVFNVLVDRDSSLDSLRSTANDLKVVNVDHVTEDTPGVEKQKAGDANGNLEIGPVPNVGDMSIGAGPDLTTLEAESTDTVGLKDVRAFNASDFNGDISLGAAITSESLPKYLQLPDTQDNPNADDVTFDYNLGSGSDALDLNIAKNVAGNMPLQDGSVASFRDMDLDVTGGAGDDAINVKFGNGEGQATGTLADNWLIGQRENGQQSVDAGSGDDVVRTPGAGNLELNGGAGNDTIYTDNTGAQGEGVDGTTKAKFVVNTADQSDPAARDVSDLETGVVQNRGVMPGAQLQVTFQGVESSYIDIPTGGLSVEASDTEVNQAIKDAVNNDPVLNQLISAEDGPGGTLTFTSKIAGSMSDGDLNLDFRNPAGPNDTPAAGQNQLSQAEVNQLNDNGITLQDIQNNVDSLSTASDYDPAFGTSNGVTLAGSDSSQESDNLVNGGSGNDTIVLGTSSLSQDVVEFGPGFASANTDTIVNFDEGGGHALDFTPLLGGVAASSTSFAEVTNGDTLGDSSIGLVDFSAVSLTDSQDETISFDGLTGSALENAVNADTGDLSGINAEAEAQTQHVFLVAEDAAGASSNTTDIKVFSANSQDDADTGDNLSVSFEGSFDLADVNADDLAANTATDDVPDGLLQFGGDTGGGNTGGGNTGGGNTGGGNTGGGNTGGGTTGGSETQSVTAADAGTTLDATGTATQNDDDVLFDFAQGTYSVTIDGFDSGDDLEFFGATDASVSVDGQTQTSGSDGEFTLEAAAAGDTVTVNFTGVDPADDANVIGIAGFESTFGTGDIA